jgi:hypothetical protein
LWGKALSLANYNSSANDSLSEYFTIAGNGIMKLTSIAGQPAQLQLNTADNSGYPGSYTSLVLQRGSKTKWVATNKGANGDTLGIAGVSGEVASFMQAGVFVYKGERIAVTNQNMDYTVTAADSEIRVDCSAGPLVITLPAATGTGQVYRIKKVDGSNTAAAVLPLGGDRIDGAASVVLSIPYSGLTLVDGAQATWDLF